MCLQFEIVCARSGQALSPSPFASVTDWMQPSIPLKRCGADALSSNTIAQQHYSGLQGCNPTEKMHYLSWPRSRTHPQPIEELRPLPMVMSYGPSNRIFPSFYRIFPGEFEGKIQLAHTPIRHRAAFMRIETEGVATEHRWLDELQRSPFAKLVFRETTGTKRRLKTRFQPAWLHRCVPGMRRPTSNLGQSSSSYPVVRMRLQLEEGWGAGRAESERKPFSTLKMEVGRSTTFFTSKLVHSSFQLGVMSCPMSRPRRRGPTLARSALCLPRIFR